MKNIYEILKEFGLELPEEKKADFEKAWKENYRTKNEYDNAVAKREEYDNAVTKRDEYKSSLDTVNERLKEFDGVDVKDLQSQITKLQGDLQAKDAEYAQKEAERQFNGELSAAIKKAGGRNEKAVMAMLDMETLKASKNQSADIEAAIGAVKESDAYLFGSDEPFKNPVGSTGCGGSGKADGVSALRAAMGLPENK